MIKKFKGQRAIRLTDGREGVAVWKDGAGPYKIQYQFPGGQQGAFTPESTAIAQLGEPVELKFPLHLEWPEEERHLVLLRNGGVVEVTDTQGGDQFPIASVFNAFWHRSGRYTNTKETDYDIVKDLGKTAELFDL